MNNGKTSRPNKLHWQHLILFVGFISAVALNFSCSKENTTDTKNDEYYVKYEVNSSTIYIGGKLNVILKGEDNQNKNFAINTRSPWETVIGPVKKGFQANLSVNDIGNNFGHLTLQAKISVSKNGSPFALKENDGSNAPRTSVQINYVIDY